MNAPFNIVVPTRPLGDISNAAASTEFVSKNATVTNIVPFTGGGIDDTVAFQAAIDLAISKKGEVLFSGNVNLLSGQVTISGAVTIRGYGWDQSVIQLPGLTQNGFNVTTTSPIIFEHFKIIGTVGNHTAGAGINISSVGTNQYTYLNHVKFETLFNGLNAVTILFWWMDDCLWLNCRGVDLTFASPGNDQVGLVANGCRFEKFFVGSENIAHGGVYFSSSSVNYFVNCRFDGGFYQFHLNLEAGFAGGELFILGCSFENLEQISGQAAACILFGQVDGTSSIGQIIIANCEISPLPGIGGGTNYGVINGFAAGKFRCLTIANNNFNSNSAATQIVSFININNCSGLWLGGNIFQVFGTGGTATGITVGSGCTDVYFGQEVFMGTNITTKHVNNVPTGSYTYAMSCQMQKQNIATGTGLGTLFSGTATVTYTRAFDSAFPVLVSGGPTDGSNLPVSLGFTGTPGATSCTAFAIGASNATHSFFIQSCGMID